MLRALGAGFEAHFRAGFNALCDLAIAFRRLPAALVHTWCYLLCDLRWYCAADGSR